MNTWQNVEAQACTDDETLMLQLSKHQRYRAKNLDYVEREKKRMANRDRSVEYGVNRDRVATRPFLGWDSEGTNNDATVFLFGSSDGDRIAKPRIRSQEMFNLVLSAELRNPDYIHVVYGAEYDFNMMLRDLPRRNLLVLRRYGTVLWEGYTIEHIPRKWFTISKKYDGKRVRAQIFDVISFFGCSYVQALIENKIGDETQLERIKVGKEDRADFTFSRLPYIESYWRTELDLLPMLMDHLRDSFYSASVRIASWHGPGAIARFMLKQHGILDCMDTVPDDVHDAARYAFAGGRFESFRAGLFEGTVYNVDINSAYPYAATMLPNLARGQWIHETGMKWDIRFDEFALYHISYDNKNSLEGICYPPFPLFRRYHDDRVMWPYTVEGWYWSPEAFTVRDDPRANIIERWVFKPYDSADKPFRFLAEYYERRATLKRMGDSMQLTYKLGINSVYGQLAQRAGWERGGKPPKFHQIEYAGFITSMCRAMVYEVAKECWKNNGLISIDTDGVFSTEPIPAGCLRNGLGDNLGQWSQDTVSGILYWQSGIYFLPDPNDSLRWSMAKSRGAPRGKVPFESAMDSLHGGLSAIEYTRNELIGYRRALQSKDMKQWRHFVTTPRKMEFGGSEFSKRYHNAKLGCRKCRWDDDKFPMHDLFPAGAFTVDPMSCMHVLPWENNDHTRPIEYLDLKDDAEMVAQWADENGVDDMGGTE